MPSSSLKLLVKEGRRKDCVMLFVAVRSIFVVCRSWRIDRVDPCQKSRVQV